MLIHPSHLYFNEAHLQLPSCRNVRSPRNLWLEQPDPGSWCNIERMRRVVVSHSSGNLHHTPCLTWAKTTEPRPSTITSQQRLSDSLMEGTHCNLHREEINRFILLGIFTKENKECWTINKTTHFLLPAKERPPVMLTTICQLSPS